MIVQQTTIIIFRYPQDYLLEQEWLKNKGDTWVHKGTSTLSSIYESEISYSIEHTDREDK